MNMTTVPKAPGRTNTQIGTSTGYLVSHLAVYFATTESIHIYL